MLAFCWGLILPGGGGRGHGFVPAFVGTGLSPVLMSLVLQDADRFTLPSRFEEGKEKCPYDPSRGYTGLIVGKWHFTRSGHFGSLWGQPATRALLVEGAARLGISFLLLPCLGHVDVAALGLSPQSLGYGGHADGCLPCADGGLYTATRYEFRSLPDIRRNLHQRPLKTEESPLHWLNGKGVPVPQDWCLGLSRVVCCRGNLRQRGAVGTWRVPNCYLSLHFPQMPSLWPPCWSRKARTVSWVTMTKSITSSWSEQARRPRPSSTRARWLGWPGWPACAR